MYGLKHLFAAAAKYQKPPLRCVPIRHSSRQSRRAAAKIDRIGRKPLPKELLGSVVTLTCESSAAGGVCNVYLVGSDHNLEESWQDVRVVVRCLKPEAVFVELCSSRTFMLELENRKVLTMRAIIKEMVELWKTNHTLSWILYKGYSMMMWNYFGSRGGGDMRAAYEEAMKYGAKVVLGDVPIDITDQRYLAKTSLWHMFEPRSITLPQDLQKHFVGAKFHAGAIDRFIEEITKKYPVWAEINIHERDRYMSAKLLEVARQHKSVVAVMGMNHVPGIKRNWKQPVDVEQLLSIPIEKKPITLEGVASFIRAVYVMVKFWRAIRRNVK